MDFSWRAEELAFKDAVIDFARAGLNDDVIERDQAGVFPRELWQKCADFGILGLPFPEKYGGQEADILTTTLVMEGLGYACKDSGLIFGMNAQMWSVQMPILSFGSEVQKSRYLPKLIQGEWIGAHGMTEPDSGSDAFNLRTTAELRGERWVLNGSKTFVSNAPEADVFVVFAATDKRKGFMGISAFLLERDFPGFQVGRTIEKMGLRTCPMSELAFDGCEVPLENRLGEVGNGATIFNHSMEWERACILASQLGGMERQLEACVRYARDRKQFNQPIGRFQSVSHKLADMKVRLETARWILYKVAWAKKHQDHAPIDAAIAKLYVSEAWVQSCRDAIQIHGGYGYTTEYEMERDLRDAVAGTLYSGTSEIQRNLVARMLGV